jgi:hypothetical protein
MTMSPMACKRIARMRLGGVDLFQVLQGINRVVSFVEKNIDVINGCF